MKNYHYKHKVKLRTKQPDLISYLIKVLLGTLPLVSYFLIERALLILKEISIILTLPDHFFLIACAILLINTFYTWFASPISFSKTQRMKNSLKTIIEVNNFYYENTELSKIILSMVIKFYQLDNKLYLEVYPNGGQFTHKMNELTQKRTTKQPLSMPSAGSTFKRPTGYYAGKLIEDSGLRGLTLRGAQVSEKHCGFVVSLGDATAKDVLDLIFVIKSTVYAKFGVMLEEEVKIVGED